MSFSGAAAVATMSSAIADVCSVCGDRATRFRYSHYGTTSCFSCRAFFRRAVEKRSYTNYTCSGDGTCVVTVATRKKCPYCRFRKCKRVGMRHSREQRAVTGSSSSSDETAAGHQLPLLVPSSEVLTLTDQDEIARLVNLNRGLDRVSGNGSHVASGGISLGHQVMQMGNDMVRCVMSAFFDAAINRSVLDVRASAFTYAFGINKLVGLARSVMDFEALESVADKKALLLSNLDPMFNVRMGHFFTCGASSLMEQLEQLSFSIFDTAYRFSVCVSWIPSMSPPMSWNQFFSSWAGGDDEQTKYAKLMGRIGDLRLDISSASIFTMVTLFSADDPKLALEHSAAVKSAQDKYKALLYKYLRHTRGSREKAVAAYQDFMSVAANLKEMSEIISKRTIMPSLVV